ncbi:hypothetical protein [uncultured Paraglaciecola sp.]|uniref:hypothetical protein n=1 Tax=uncultured Paraglaciecola sp. TaxID=1765024 RepID=UPI002623E106|nr:hypothetical protein [uncultured Paraglaciecola sp.]
MTRLYTQRDINRLLTNTEETVRKDKAMLKRIEEIKRTYRGAANDDRYIKRHR